MCQSDPLGLSCVDRQKNSICASDWGLSSTPPCYFCVAAVTSERALRPFPGYRTSKAIETEGYPVSLPAKQSVVATTYRVLMIHAKQLDDQ